MATDAAQDMPVLLYDQLDAERIPNFAKMRDLLARGDFRSADVKKVSDTLYRARLDRSNRLLFTFARYRDSVYILVLEFIANHAYHTSRFLRRGVTVDESKLPELLAPAPEDAVDMAYVNPNGRAFNVLDKVISFDDDQQAVFAVSPPLIVVGSAGSGKTALTLEKMKAAEGNVLYVTRSPFLADSARELYYGMNYENEQQDVSFLSFAEFLESIRVPKTRELTFREFADWFAKHRVASGIKDAHQFYEEVQGVITGASADDAWLSKEAYLALGVRQSIYAVEERAKVYDLFGKYLDHLGASGCHDINVLSYEHQQLAKPVWDFVVVDEVQDLTNVQLQLVLCTLTDPAHFILCGDSNQIVHPNLFSWAGLKRHFYERSHERTFSAADGQPRQSVQATDVMRVLTTNYRSSRHVTELANRILRLKTARFRSVDRESNYLVSSSSDNAGVVTLLPDDPRLVRQLDARTRTSTRFAVVVMHPDDKAKARTRFHTPLVFSIQEAKGLEYENIILYDFVSSAEERFREICRDVDAEQVQAGELRYARGRDKSDKSLEIYKFHINALYVAATRAIANVYLVEPSPRQRLFDLLGVEQMQGELDLAEQQSSLADWQREARKLERQGKQEQAEAVRADILGLKKTPWQPLDRQAVRTLADDALAGAGKKKQLQLFEYALLSHDGARLARLKKTGFRPAQRPLAAGERALVDRHFMAYSLKRVDAARGLVEKYGVDHRDAFGFTPLMLAARFGNPLVAAMLVDDMQADVEPASSAGLNALQIMLQEMTLDERYAQRFDLALFSRLAPAATTVMVGGALVKIDNHKAEFLFYNVMMALFQTRLADNLGRTSAPGIQAADILKAVRALPRSAVPEYQTKRAYISSVLARNEVDRDVSYNRRLFKRTQRGFYILNPQLRVRIGQDWLGIYELLDTDAVFRRRQASEAVENVRWLMGTGKVLAADAETEDAALVH